MKYDRPVWQIMHECADAMPEVFRYDDVRGWFVEHYPDVNEATIRAHLIGLTEGGRAKHVQFAPRSPVFRRVARGEYSPIPAAERGEDPNPPGPSASRLKMSGNGHHHAPPTASATPAVPPPPAAETDDVTGSVGPAASTFDDAPPMPDIILLGSVGERVNVPAPAKEVYREVSFQLSRLDAELSGSEWFILSAEHGLLAPNEWMSPDSRTLADMDPGYRVVWASWVVARLQSLVGSLDGMIVRVDAPDAFVGPLFAELQDVGAAVSSGSIVAEEVDEVDEVDGADEVAAAAEQDAPVPVRHDELVEAAADRLSVHEIEPPRDGEVPAPVVDPDLATVSDIGRLQSAGHHLADVRHAVPADEADSLPTSPGLYAWIVDPIGARVLNRCLRLPVRTGVVFVGEVGGSTWHALIDPVVNLRDHVSGVQLNGRTRASTFRMTLATVLGDHLGLTSLDDPRLTEWMTEHLSVTTWPVDDGDNLRELARHVIDQLDPPLNVDHLASAEYRARLLQMRGELA
ncbi:DUF7669 domain-containing protein [Aeromicrobium fastidiosum]|uniref:Uncharacterized protein n=1 Tax=Aeromicrobium fastidiosum TaxID=52699 RepID=A0A641AJQ8_9ACTN|nr:DUF6884 domain-containing protein [Aeromicrobium fastidiosum]KAA1376067.1 hypothetical protein ESP62_011475 [Aeromicrobium fastidiosum]MBP2392061.1 hypothetical protein [Aeromicrobium fastidiosum]